MSQKNQDRTEEKPRQNPEHPYLALLRERNALEARLESFDLEIAQHLAVLQQSPAERKRLKAALFSGYRGVSCEGKETAEIALVRAYAKALLQHCEVATTHNVLDLLEIFGITISKKRKDMRVRDILRGCPEFSKQQGSKSHHRLLWRLTKKKV